MGNPPTPRWFPVVAAFLVCMTIGSMLVALDGVTGHSRRPKASGPTPIAGSDLHLRGRYVFQRHCAVCHGRWGDGRGEMSVGMRPRPRDFTTGVFKFRSTPSGFLPTDEDLRRTLRRGIANSSMPAFGSLTENEVEAVIAYIKTLSPRWMDGTASDATQDLGMEPSWLGDPVGSAGHRAAGEVTFVTHCAPCHGVAGDGVSAVADSLEDIWGQPSPPADLRSTSLKSGPEPIDVFRTLSTGLDGSPMPSFAESLSAVQRWDLVAYLFGLRRSNETPCASETR
jgi:mono/diheme cytochrome c family protein